MINKELCDKVVAVAKKGGNFIREQRKTFSLSAVEYKGLNDLVSYVDKETEKILVDGLKNLIPDAGFITEENTITLKDREYVWIIDPLDGTTNFVHGLPCFCVSIGLMHNGEMVLGVIYEINLDECFYGWSGGGAWCNGSPIKVSSCNELSKGLIATGFPYTNYDRMTPYMAVFDYCMHNTHGLRRLGSAAVDLAYVACGRMEGFFEYGLNAWDVAAGCFLVKEAGGKVSDFKGGDDYVFGKEILACNTGIHEEFLGVIKNEFSK